MNKKTINDFPAIKERLLKYKEQLDNKSGRFQA
jgi:hypothetical protein